MPSSFERLARSVASLTPKECRELISLLEDRASSGDVCDITQDLTESTHECVHCKCTRILRWGKQRGVQRYRCSACAKTFSATTGTPLHRLRHKATASKCASSMQGYLSVRDLARKHGIHRNTALRWRHRFVSYFDKAFPPRLSGLVEADETFFRKSYKGKKGPLGRKPHKRGERAPLRGVSRHHVPVLVAHERSTKAIHLKVLPGRTGPAIKDALAEILESGVDLHTDGLAAYQVAGRALDVTVLPSTALPVPKRLGHLQHVNQVHQDLEDWLKPLHGVSTKHLPKYLAWYRISRQGRRSQTPNQFLRALLRLA